MRDASGEAPHGFHLLRVAQLSLGAIERLLRALAFVHLALQRSVGLAQFARAFLDAHFQLRVRALQGHPGFFALGDVQGNAQ